TKSGSKKNDLDSALINWFKLHRNKDVRISGEMVTAQANIFHKERNLRHECDCLQRWLQKFQNKHSISLDCMCSEKRSSDTEAAAKYVDKFSQLVANEKLSPEQVYNTDETALYWCCMPTKMLAKIVLWYNDEEYVTAKISIDKCIQLATNLVEGLEQRHFISEQAIMSLYMIREKLIKEEPKYMRQAPLEVWLKVARRSVEQHSTVRSPVASTSSTPDIHTAETPDVI
uniref:HTH CENPB-type domain-containing protein n=1 Tax=Chelonoidis abingdonii TaxID=106734 RepID=A0A8C0IRW6_CHEAB